MAKIEDYMLPCLNKKYLGMECPGCGLQRSAVMIVKGEFVDAFFMYPAVYSLIAFFGFVIFNHFKTYKYANKIIITLAILNVVIIVGSFLTKLYFKHN